MPSGLCSAGFLCFRQFQKVRKISHISWDGSMQLQTCEETYAPNMSVHMHRWCAYRQVNPALRYFSVHSSDFLITATQKSGPTAATTPAAKSATILLPVTSEQKVSTPVKFAPSPSKMRTQRATIKSKTSYRLKSQPKF